MNTTQRKFAINRIYELYCQKAGEIQVKEQALFDKFLKLRNPSGNIIISAIKSGKINLVKNIPKTNTSLKIGHFYDLTPITKNSVSFAKMQGGLNESIDLTFDYHYESISVKNPIHSANQCSKQFKFYFNQGKKKLEQINVAMRVVTESIMLGDSAEAAEAIACAEKRIF